MEGIFYIHNIFLDNDKYLVHCSPSNSSEVVFKECTYLYSFARKNKPIKILYTEEVTEFSNIDINVKFYMHLYGISNVRGGTFHQEELPDYMLKTLEEEIKTMTTRVYEQICIVNEMMNECENYNSDNYTIDFFENKINIVEKKLSTYAKILERKTQYNRRMCLQETQKTHTNDDYTSENTSQQEITVTNKLIDELCWFSDLVHGKDHNEVNEESQNRALRFISIYTKILNMFVSMIGEKKCMESNTFEEIVRTEVNDDLYIAVVMPYTYFKSYIYNRELIDVEKDENNTLELILKKMEYIIQYVLNRMDEIDYDISRYPENMTELCDSLLYHYNKHIENIKYKTNNHDTGVIENLL